MKKVHSEESPSNLVETPKNPETKKFVDEGDQIYEVETHIFCIDTLLFLEKYNSIKKGKQAIEVSGN